MPPSPCRGSTNTAAVFPFTIAARALSRSSYFASRAPPMSGMNGVLYCSCALSIPNAQPRSNYCGSSSALTHLRHSYTSAQLQPLRSISQWCGR